MGRTATAALLFMLLQIVLGANPYRKLLKDFTFCQEKYTTCKMSSGDFGCCPAVNGVCCGDGEHCCPSQFVCFLAAKQCVQYGSVYVVPEDLLDLYPIGSKTVREDRGGVKEALTLLKPLSADTGHVCPGGSMQCSDNMTCCEVKSPGTYSCCPESNAVCCSTGMYCCPGGYTCNDDKGTCVKDTVEMPARSLKEPEKVVCPDHDSECHDGNTCCKLADGNYACCPLANAVCCSDHVHCCPEGYTCDVEAGSCTSLATQLYARLTNKKPPVPSEVNQMMTPTKKVTCPDKSKCPEHNTCCEISATQYGCCPQPNATCCADKKHCCPNGYICDKPTGTCMKSGVEQEVVTLQELVIKAPNSVPCPDGGSCRDGQTCCPTGPSTYGCCPYPSAACCSDYKHCCPEGYTCETGSGTCMQAGNEGKAIPFQEIIVSPASVPCHDGGSCADGQTCCPTGPSTYGCCPYPSAVCCSDYKHCCPEGYTCDVSSGACYNEAAVRLSFSKIVKRPRDDIKNIVCPGNQQACPDNNSCCLQSSGQYGCCPLPNAVCCSNSVHCCPSGFVCDVTNLKCIKRSPDCDEKTGDCLNSAIIKMNLIENVKHIKDLVKYKDIECPIECPGGEQYCPNGETCCPNSDGGYGCCPLEDAECCSDHKHCCPSGYACDVSQGTCYKSSLDCGKEGCPNVTIVNTDVMKHVNYVYCPDGGQCYDGETCCLNIYGEYGCCPYPYASCCSDGENCCPAGHICYADGCLKSSSSGVLEKIPFLVKKFPARGKL